MWEAMGSSIEDLARCLEWDGLHGAARAQLRAPTRYEHLMPCIAAQAAKRLLYNTACLTQRQAYSRFPSCSCGCSRTSPLTLSMWQAPK
jgi:hypothetical protein